MLLIVFLPSGAYHLKSSIRPKSNIILRGEGPSTKLTRPAYYQTSLIKDAEKGEREIYVKETKGFEPGMDVVFRDNEKSYVDVDKSWAIIKEVKKDKLVIDRGLPFSVSVKKDAMVMNSFRIIYAQNIEGVSMENLSIDGNCPKEKTKGSYQLTGIELEGCKNCKVINCIAYRCGGYGISCDDGEFISFIECESYQNIWHGFHIGTTKEDAVSKNCTVSNCYAHHNEGVGIYICWRVKESIFIGNHIVSNQGDGLLIGPYDDRNLIANNIISGNGGCGIIVCRRAHPNESNAFLNNMICNNGKTGETPAIKVENPQQGEYRHLLFARNMIVETRDVKTPKTAAIYIDEQTDYITVCDNSVQGRWQATIENHSKGMHNCISIKE